MNDEFIPKLSKEVSLFLKISQQINDGPKSVQEGDPYIKALIDNKVMGIMGNASDHYFDTKSTAANQIMQAVESNEFNGTIDLNIIVPGSGDKPGAQLQVITSPNNQKLNSTLQNLFATQVNRATAKCPLQATASSRNLVNLNFS